MFRSYHRYIEQQQVENPEVVQDWGNDPVMRDKDTTQPSDHSQQIAEDDAANKEGPTSEAAH